MPTPRASIEGGGPGGRLTYVQSPIDPTQWLCWCGQLQPTEAAAAECRHIRPRLPVIPQSIAFNLNTGFVDRPPAAAEVRVELPRLQQHLASERRRAGVGALIILVAWVLLVLIMAFMPARSDDPGPIVTPTTYGWPGPTGGFTSMPVAPR